MIYLSSRHFFQLLVKSEHVFQALRHNAFAATATAASTRKQSGCARNVRIKRIPKQITQIRKSPQANAAGFFVFQTSDCMIESYLDDAKE
jgi:hypothetical protein